jgi:hypothetical protein
MSKPWLQRGDKVHVTSLLQRWYPLVYTVVAVDREGIGHYQVQLDGGVGWIDPAHLEIVQKEKE